MCFICSADSFQENSFKKTAVFLFKLKIKCLNLPLFFNNCLSVHYG